MNISSNFTGKTYRIRSKARHVSRYELSGRRKVYNFSGSHRTDASFIHMQVYEKLRAQTVPEKLPKTKKGMLIQQRRVLYLIESLLNTIFQFSVDISWLAIYASLCVNLWGTLCTVGARITTKPKKIVLYIAREHPSTKRISYILLCGKDATYPNYNAGSLQQRKLLSLKSSLSTITR